MNNGLMGFPGLQAGVEPGDLPEFKVRAWANFRIASPVCILKGSGNISSITYVGAGTYQVNMSIPMPDTNYMALYQAQNTVSQVNTANYVVSSTPFTPASFQCQHVENAAGSDSTQDNHVMVVR